jgi:hypothetical protein
MKPVSQFNSAVHAITEANRNLETGKNSIEVISSGRRNNNFVVD